MRELAAFVASIDHLVRLDLVEAVRGEVLRIGGSWVEELDADPTLPRVAICISLHHVFASGPTTAEACEAWRASARRAVHTLTTIAMEEYP